MSQLESCGVSEWVQAKQWLSPHRSSLQFLLFASLAAKRSRHTHLSFQTLQILVSTTVIKLDTASRKEAWSVPGPPRPVQLMRAVWQVCVKLSGEELPPGNTARQVRTDEPQRNRNSDAAFKIKVERLTSTAIVGVSQSTQTKSKTNKALEWFY